MIDEKKLIEDLKQYAHLSAGDSVDTIKVIIKIVGDQTKIGEWIPCSERLPEMHREDMEAEGEYYMISNPVIVTDGKQIYISLNTKLIWITDMVGTALMEKIMII